MQISSNSSKLTNGDNHHEDDSSFFNSEERYKTLVANIPGAVYRCTWDFTDPAAGLKRTIAFLSDTIQDISGYPSSDFVNDRVRCFASIIHPQDRKNVEAVLIRSVTAKIPYILEYRIVRADGGISWVYEGGQAISYHMEAENLASRTPDLTRQLDLKIEQENGNIEEIEGQENFLNSLVSSLPPIPNPQLEFVYLDGVILDITDRKQATEAVREKESYYRCIVETASEGVWMFDTESKTTFANTRMAEMLGYTVEEMLGRSLFEFIDGEERAIAQTYVQRRKQGIRERHDFKFTRKNGSHLWAIVSATPMFDVNGEFSGVLRMITDISDRKLAEAELLQTQSMMVQNEKMVSLGQLVAGVAHEINNPVSFIYGNVQHADDYFKDLLKMIQLYQQEYPKPTPVIQQEIDDVDLNFMLQDLPKLLNSMKMGAERIRQIVLSLKNFSRLDESEQKHVDIHEGIDSTLLILQHRLKETAGHPKIVLLKEFGDLPRVQCYPGQLNQVFMNIIGNAIDALEEAMETGLWANGEQSLIPYCPSPTLRICTEVKYEQDSLMQKENVVDASNRHPTHLVIRIADNGPGIPVEVHKRLFDPFFTTKEPGKGTGLGLSISYQIVVEKHGGQLHCNSAPGQGTEFAIEIPVGSSQ